MRRWGFGCQQQVECARLPGNSFIMMIFHGKFISLGKLGKIQKECTIFCWGHIDNNKDAVYNIKYKIPLFLTVFYFLMSHVFASRLELRIAAEGEIVRLFRKRNP